jgi:hypothetical protein
MICRVLVLFLLCLSLLSMSAKLASPIADLDRGLAGRFLCADDSGHSRAPDAPGRLCDHCLACQTACDEPSLLAASDRSRSLVRFSRLIARRPAARRQISAVVCDSHRARAPPV